MDETNILEDIIGKHRVSQTDSGLYVVEERKRSFEEHSYLRAAIAAVCLTALLASASNAFSSDNQNKQKPKGPPTVVELQYIDSDNPDIERTEANVLNLHGRGFDFKGGVGDIDNKKTDTETKYVAGVIKIPSIKIPSFNDLLVLFNFNGINLEGRSYKELELRAKANLKRFILEGGFVDRDGTIKDSNFFSSGYKFDLTKIFGKGYFALARAGLIRSDNRSSDIGVIFGNENGSLGFNINDAQRRASIGYRVPNGLGFDILYIDNDINNEPKIYMVNATLDATGGFTGNQGREARIIGPTSTSFANPISDLTSFNRLAYLTEVGDKANFRIRCVEKPNGDLELKGDVILFPTQWFQHGHPYLDALFFGPAYDKNRVNGKPDRSLGGQVGVKDLDLGMGWKLNAFYRHAESDSLVVLVTYSF